MTRSLFKRLAVVVLIAVALVLGWAKPVTAHAELESTEPASGAQLTEAPKQVSMKFPEPVEISFGAIVVFNERSERMEIGEPAHLAGDNTVVQASLPTLPAGGYVVTWRVLSADSHPINGAFTFQVGAPSGVDTSALSKQLLADSSGFKSTEIVYAIVRALEFASVMLMLGALGFLVAFGLDRVTSIRARRLFFAAAGVLVLATVGGFALQGLYASALPLGRVADGRVLSDTLATRYGVGAIARVLAILMIVVAVRFVGTTRTSSRIVVAAAALGLIASVSVSGHASTGRWVPFAMIADVVHIGAASLWIGGLIVLIAVVMRRADGARDVITWFSGLAFWCVIAMAITGAFQGWRQMRTLDALLSSDYGVFLLVKLGVFAALLVAANFSRRWVNSSSTDVRRVRRSVGVEVLLALGVIGATTMLVSAPPVPAAVSNEPISTEIRGEGFLVDIAMDPARVGPNSVFFYVLSEDGKLKDVPEVKATFANPDKNIPPLDAPLQKVRAGSYASSGFVVPTNGKWRVDITVRTSEVDQSTVSTQVKVR